MDNSFLMNVLDRVADLEEEPSRSTSREIVLVAVVSDFDASHQFHHKYGLPALVSPHPVLGRCWMVHARSAPAVQLEAGNELLGVKAEFD